MNPIIKAVDTEISRYYEGDFPGGSVVFEGTLNGQPFKSSKATEINPVVPTNADDEFDYLVKESGAIPHIRVACNGEFWINFQEDGYPVDLAPNMLPHEVADRYFANRFVNAIPAAAIEERNQILERKAARAAAVAEWLAANPEREEWEYGLDEMDGEYEE
jgi:hypothetical protein